MKNTFNNFVNGIGNTPLIRLNGPSELTGCNIYGKAEFLNPGGSVKDRAAWALIKDAEEKKLISKGGTIVEGTAGNTGIGLCLIGNSRGYKTIIVMPETQTQEKKDILKSIGADLRLVPAKPYKDPNNYVKYSGKLAEDLKKNILKMYFGQINLTKLPTIKVITKQLAQKFGTKQKVKLMPLFVPQEQEELSQV